MRVRDLFLPGCDPDGVDTAPPLSERAWQITVVALHAIFAVLVVLSAVELWRGGGVVHPGLGAAALTVLVGGYLIFGRPALGADASARAVGYLAVLVVTMGVLAWCTPACSFLLFVAFPQIWFLVQRPLPGAVWSVLLASSSTLGVAAHDLLSTRGYLLGDVVGNLIGLAVSLGMGLWTTLVVGQSERQAVLIAELERTQAELATAHHDRGVLAERERLARDVHDTLAQGYTSVVMLAQTAAGTADPDVRTERLAMIEEVARENLREARALVAALSPVEIAGTTLRAALTTLADRFARETGIAVQVDLATDVGGLDRSDEVVLLRSAQEALNNARRHAVASAVELRLERQDGAVAVRVVDDGVGFATDAARGSGLAGLRRRLEQAGGSLEIDSTPGVGTRVVARVVSAG